jgi:hypothetical protein
MSDPQHLVVVVLQDMELQSQVYDPMSSWQKEYARMKVRFTSAYEPQLP